MLTIFWYLELAFIVLEQSYDQSAHYLMIFFPLLVIVLVIVGHLMCIAPFLEHPP